MEELKAGWHVKGTYNEACASEGHCPYYFGRDVEGGCRYFEVFRIEEGQVNEVDISGITIIYCGDIHYPKFIDFAKYGSEGCVYVSDGVTEDQRRVLDVLAKTSIGALDMRKIFALKYVKIDVEEIGEKFFVKMPSGEMEQRLMKGLDGAPIRIENAPMPPLKDLKACHTEFWTYNDHGKNWEYRNRCGTWANFSFSGISFPQQA